MFESDGQAERNREGRGVRRTLVLNAKGGCGKTTIATNLAAYYAQRHDTTLLDYDPQGSSLRWLQRRGADRPAIDGVRAYARHPTGMTRTWMTHNPRAERTVVDAPAGINGPDLADLVRDVDAVIIPVLPSPIDIQAAADFVRDLLLDGRSRQRGVRLAVVANRARTRTRIYGSLERFLASLDLPFLTTLRDSQNYVRAVERGLGIHELGGKACEPDLEQWAPLLRWLEAGSGTGTVTPFPRETSSSGVR